MSKRLKELLAGVGLVITTASAHASGLASGTTAMQTFETWLYTFLGIVALIYLMWKGFESWTDKAQWSDFGIAVAKVAAVGAVVVLGPWAWSVFAS